MKPPLHDYYRLRRVMPAKKTAAGLPVPQLEVAPKPSPLFVYAKALVGFLITLVPTLTGWVALLPPGPIDRTGWVTLAGALTTSVGVALGVAVTTNAKTGTTPPDDAGNVGVLELAVIALVVVVILLLIGVID